MAISHYKQPTAPSASLQISERQVEDFLLATQPCFVNFPTEMRGQVREALQARVDRGELTAKHFDDFAHQAGVERALRSGAGF